MQINLPPLPPEGHFHKLGRSLEDYSGVNVHKEKVELYYYYYLTTSTYYSFFIIKMFGLFRR